jgi:hypothetical protein
MNHHGQLLQVAFNDHERLMESESDLVLAINQRAFDDPVDYELIASVADFVRDSADACRMLPSRSRRARLNMRWKDFLAAQRARSPESGTHNYSQSRLIIPYVEGLR